MKKLIFILIILFILISYRIAKANEIFVTYYPPRNYPTPIVIMKSKNYKLEILQLER